MKSKRVFALVSVAVCLGFTLFTACSSGPKPPERGTPAFYWAEAKDAYRLGDFQKVSSSLANITRTENEFAARARAWEVIHTAGMAQGYAVVADAYDEGAKKNRQNPLPFRKQVTVFRIAASAAAVQCAEAYRKFIDTNKDATVALAFEPPADIPEPPELKKVTSGIPLPDAELERVAHATIQRGILTSSLLAVGAKGNTAKGVELIKAGQVPRETFIVGMAQALFDTSDLFGSKKMDQPNRVKMLCQQAIQGLQAVPSTQNTKALTDKIQSTLKKQKLS